MRSLFAAALCALLLVPARAGVPAELDAALAPADGGAPVKLSSFKSKVVLLEFWTTYCEPCRDAKPFFEDLQKRFADRGLVILAVDNGEDAKTVRAYLKDRPTTLRVLLDPRGRLARRLRLRKDPAMALFDVNDELAWSAVGFEAATQDDLVQRLDRLLPGDPGRVPIGALK